MTDAVDYRNPQKNQWRARVWGAIRAATPNPSSGLVLYLPGSTDLDARIAVRRGFRLENMVAIDRDKSIISQLRADRRIAINADLFETLLAWPDHVKVGAVIADLQCGLTDDVLRSEESCRERVC